MHLSRSFSSYVFFFLCCHLFSVHLILLSRLSLFSSCVHIYASKRECYKCLCHGMLWLATECCSGRLSGCERMCINRYLFTRHTIATSDSFSVCELVCVFFFSSLFDYCCCFCWKCTCSSSKKARHILEPEPMTNVYKKKNYN